MNASEAPASEVTLAYVVLAHEGPEQIIGLVRTLLDADPTGRVIVHYDLKAPLENYVALKGYLADEERACVVEDRARCDWGRFGLVDAVVRALRVIRRRNFACDYIYLLSGSCMPTKPLAMLKRFLADNRGMEFIESHPPEWIVNGLREERYQYRHWFSFRSQRRLFDGSFRTQRALGLKRKLPMRLSPRFGSQWWCLTTDTCYSILDFIDKYPGAYRFFRSTWIPDELFFQTAATFIAGEARIFNRNLTFFKFSWKGRPIAFYDDHIDLAPNLPYFFARKIAPTAHTLRSRLAEIAAAPDDGAPFPLAQATTVFDFDKRVAQQVENPRPGQLFYGGQSFSGWPSSFAQSKIVFAVLHGPPAVTRVVREHLGRTPGLTQLGRVFRPDKVDLEALGPSYIGFGPQDVRIRDMDPPLYLSRLLARADGFPIIEICPGDVPHGEGYFYFNERVLFISCQPDHPAEELSRRLYWSLCAAAHAADRGKELIEPGVEVDASGVREGVDAAIERFTPGEHRTWITDTLLTDRHSPAFLRLSWGMGRRMAAGEALPSSLNKLRSMFGPSIAPLLSGLWGIDAKLAAMRPLDVTAAFPGPWRDYFSADAGQSWDSWVAALEQSPIGYGVLFGPPALTQPVRDQLRRANGVSLLGRIFAPQTAGPASHAALSSGFGPGDLELLQRDRPQLLARLVARAKGFPVIEVVPGDVPLGESFFLHDENAIFISCQPGCVREEDRHRLYWTLVAATNAGADLDQSRYTKILGNINNVTNQIDPFIAQYTAGAHRDWITRNVLDPRPSGAFLRLVAGEEHMTGNSLPLSAELARVHHAYGDAAAPLLDGLVGIDAELAPVTLAGIARELPPTWREYFSPRVSPTYRASARGAAEPRPPARDRSVASRT